MTTEQTAVPVDPATLMESVRKQVEYYFGKENLQTDQYLLSLMDSQMSVPISAVMKVGVIMLQIFFNYLCYLLVYAVWKIKESYK